MKRPQDIRERLGALASRKRPAEPIVESAAAGHIPGVMTADAFFSQRESAPARHENLLNALPGFQFLDGPHGRTLYRQIVLEPGKDDEQAYRLGSWGSLYPFKYSGLTSIFGEDATADPARIAFVDTETTGLAGGTGVVPFLIGVGWWRQIADSWEFVLEQYLVEDFNHEADMIPRLVERLSGFDILCSYNGMTFDVPIMRTRAVMHRIRNAFRHVQYDLLHPSRRLWRGVLPSVRLKLVELEILGIDRGPDVDGALIPSIFLHMARTRRAERMAPVVDHNAQDIVTLARLLRHLTEVAADPLNCGLLSRWGEFAAVARMAARRGDLLGAAEAYRHAIERCTDDAGEEDLRTREAAIHKRRRAWDAAVEIWEHQRTLSLERGAHAWIELAKYHEHVRRDAATAESLIAEFRRKIEYDLETASFLGRTSQAATLAESLMPDLEKRARRLRARLERQARL